jgi:deoxyribodipyrimidine photolyase-related protein
MTEMIAALIYPHQLFPDASWLRGVDRVYLVEDPLFFTQYPFHRQKLMLHRASMRWYADRLRKKKWDVHYVEAAQLKTSSDIAKRLKRDGVSSARAIDPEDFNLDRRVRNACSRNGIEWNAIPDPHFLTPTQAIDAFVKNKKKLFFTQFYIEQRKRLDVLIDKAEKPIGGKWSFDTENRRRLPADEIPPAIDWPKEDAYAAEARQYVEKHFPRALGEPGPLLYPANTSAAQKHLRLFIEERLQWFGDYEDAISREHRFVYHSVLTPMLNIGLISPDEIVAAALEQSKDVPLNALEGFVRQVIGWREYIRLVYRTLGVAQRTRNYWSHSRGIPASFYDGTTGIEPVDHTIRAVLRNGYCHHIERLMILGNFMLLCEFHPDAIYQWFMEMFVDAYDWVMVPNVYGMSQHADGGMITTKPYISGSSYVLKMSDFKKGPWCELWDSLYWRFIDKHRSYFESNPRMKVMTGQLDRMGEKLTAHRRRAQTYLESLA